MDKEYIWFKNGKESKRSADEEGKLPTKEELPNGRTASYEYDDGVLVRKEIKNGDLYDGDGKPAITLYNSNGDVRKEMYFKDEKIHRSGGRPAEIHYNTETGKPYAESYYVDGKRHRADDKPAYVENFADSGLLEQWWYEGKQHRGGDKPAVISENIEGTVVHETWFIDGAQHRNGDKPSEIIYHDNGNVNAESYTKGVGILHRDGDKPAQILYNKNGEKQVSRYYKDGTKSHIVKHTERDKTKGEMEFDEISALLDL